MHLTPFGAIIHEIRTSVQQLPYVTFEFVKRDGNMLAHVLAKKALCSEGGED